MNAYDLADQPGFDSLAHISEMRRPTAVLVDGKPHAFLCRAVAEAFPDVEIEHERLLRQHVLSGVDRRLDQWDALSRMSRDVDHLDTRAVQNRLVIR